MWGGPGAIGAVVGSAGWSSSPCVIHRPGRTRPVRGGWRRRVPPSGLAGRSGSTAGDVVHIPPRVGRPTSTRTLVGRVDPFPLRGGDRHPDEGRIVASDPSVSTERSTPSRPRLQPDLPRASASWREQVERDLDPDRDLLLPGRDRRRRHRRGHHPSLGRVVHRHRARRDARLA